MMEPGMRGLYSAALADEERDRMIAAGQRVSRYENEPDDVVPFYPRSDVERRLMGMTAAPRYRGRGDWVERSEGQESLN